jgi:hypothetical protein
MTKNDPYLRDPNIRSAAKFLSFGWAALGAGVGAGISGGMLNLSPAVGVPIGALVGWLLGVAILALYGGRATR